MIEAAAEKDVPAAGPWFDNREKDGFPICRYSCTVCSPHNYYRKLPEEDARTFEKPAIESKTTYLYAYICSMQDICNKDSIFYFRIILDS